jgi:hypothetical protein
MEAFAKVSCGFPARMNFVVTLMSAGWRLPGCCRTTSRAAASFRRVATVPPCSVVDPISDGEYFIVQVTNAPSFSATTPSD